MNIDAMISAYVAQGGTITQVKQGKRTAPRSVMRNVVKGDDKRKQALALWALHRNGKA